MIKEIMLESRRLIIEVKKFGTTLVSRPAGKEAYLAFQPDMKNLPKDEDIVVDFEGVHVLTPSWADEFLRPLFDSHHKDKISLKNTENSSVVESLKILGLYDKGN